MIKLILFLLSVWFLLIGHAVRLLRWERFIKIYEPPPRNVLVRSMSIGYFLNIWFPAGLGELARGIYSGKKINSGVGFVLATIFIERFLDIVSVTIIFFGLYWIGMDNNNIRRSLIFYVTATLGIAGVLVFVNLTSRYIKRVILISCSVFNDSIRLSLLKFFWALINAFRDIKRIKIRRLIADTILMWGGYVMSYILLSSLLSMLGRRFFFRDVFCIWFSLDSLDFYMDCARVQKIIIFLYMLLCVIIMDIASFFCLNIRLRLSIMKKEQRRII